MIPQNDNIFTVLNIYKYVKIYQYFLGKKIYGIFFLSLLASITEGIGFLMLLPLLQSMNVSSIHDVLISNDSKISETIFTTFTFFGLVPTLKNVLITLCLLFSMKAILLFSSLSANAYYRGELIRKLKTVLYVKYQQVNYNYITNNNTGHFINTINEQCNRSLLGFYHLNILVSNSLNFIIFTGFVSVISFQFGISAAVIGILLLSSFKKLSSYVKNLSRKTTEENSFLSQQLIQFLQSFKFLKATSQIAVFDKIIFSSIEKLSTYQIRAGIAGSFTHSIREPLAVLVVIIFLIIQVSYLQQPIAPLLVTIIFFYKCLNYALAIQNSLQNTYDFIGAIELVNEEQLTAGQNYEFLGLRPVKQLNNQIRLVDVYYRYEHTKSYALVNCNINIQANKMTAIVGPSGSGKSTLINLLCGLSKPERGQIKFDHLNYSDINLSELRQKIGYVSQENVTFDGTIMENITLLFAADAKDINYTEVERVAKISGMEDFVKFLPQKYDTKVGDRGLKLSGGQRQRLFLARELYRSPEILLLDEATSALDVETEAVIQENIDALRGQMTLVVIAHRLSTIQNADIIYVMDHGTIVEAGTHDQLMSLPNSRFKSFNQVDKNDKI